MLWGGSGLLAFEHLWHGEIVPWFPFLTNASNPTDASIMLQEMATVGVTMSLLVTAVWGTLMFAAVISTVIWYMSKNARRLKIGVLCCSFWGTSVMWFVDAVFEYAEMGAEYFSPPALDMLNDIFL